MPKIENICQINSNKQFKKKNYRPWDLLGNGFNQEIQNKTNSEQTGAKLGTELEPNWSQTRDRTGAKLEPNWSQTGAKLGTELEPNWSQTGAKLGTELEPNLEQIASFISLSGLQKRAVLFFYKTCKASYSKITPTLSLEHIAESCKTTKAAIKKAIQRLERKKIVLRVEFKNGRNGWTKYELPKHIHQEILYSENQEKTEPNQSQTGAKLEPNWSQTGDKTGAKLGTKLEPTIFSSSSYNIYNKTTTSDIPKNHVDNNILSEWQNLDISSLQEIGFTSAHLAQIASQNKLLPDVVQNSIYAFAFDLQENNKAKSIKGDPLNFFMGILRNGKPYAAPINYESPNDKAMRMYLEKQREIEKRRTDIEEEAINLAFNEWFLKLSDEQKINLLPEMFRHNASSEKLEKSKILESSARNHFKTEVWPNLKTEIIANVATKANE